MALFPYCRGNDTVTISKGSSSSTFLGSERPRKLGLVAASVLFLSSLFLCINAKSVCAVDQPANPQVQKEVSQPITISQIEKAIGELEKRINLSKQSENEQTAQQMGVSLADLADRTERLKTIQSVYERLITALNKSSAQEEEETGLKEKIKAGRQVVIEKKPPYNLSFYDNILDELTESQQQLETFGFALKLSDTTSEDAKLRLEKAQKDWRSQKDLFDAESDEKLRRGLALALEKAQLEVELAETLVSLERANHDNLVKQVEIAGLRAQMSQLKVDWVKEHLAFDKEDLKMQLDTLANQKTELEKQVQKLIRRHAEAREKLLKAQRSSADATNGRPAQVKEDYLKASEAWVKTYQTALEHAEEKEQLLGHQERIWNLRYGLLKGGLKHEKIIEEKTEFTGHAKNLGRSLGVEQSYHNTIQAQIVSLEKKASDKDLDPQIKPHLDSQIEALKKLAERQFDYVSTLLLTEQMDRRLLDEINSKLRQARLKQGLINITKKLNEIWNFELWVIDNRAVTVRKVFVALFILVTGIIASKYILRHVTNRLFSVVSLKENTAIAIQKMLAYFAYLVVLLLAFRIVNIPLTAFAFLGGAVAIGVGFGAQNLINNFISGFILMAERPINVGDLIEVEGILGKVEEIGARSTRVRTGENIHILVPNSSFLEKNITNWTLSDRNIRARVTVGIAYGAPVREAERLLLKAAHENNKVLKAPEPFVIFGDFGDNALIFHLYFWISVRRAVEKQQIESSIRFSIDELFREAGIVIAFPQRDIHLDTLQPLEFRLVKNGVTG
ncbi:putative MscS Mechanosensitive ion channel [uncultured Desulfobacterium sp.]|uniref:Putative MscS Mechanosensitive ion channel n=1 Tax=uncultured Desulfobacterium sp. TaxID=201089 RepID=A0A445MWV7_9BACT|nr:putative MscS Mechanosensitive ion channel [uncultured Desulfobacterium sp.]